MENSRLKNFAKMAATTEQTNKKALYVVLEGVEGVGKTTQMKLVLEALKDFDWSMPKGVAPRIVATKEPGVAEQPVTMLLRNIMLNAAYDYEMTPMSREYVSQAIRSIHLERRVLPALQDPKCCLVLQDRGLLSGLAYGAACGIESHWLLHLMNNTSNNFKRVRNIEPLPAYRTNGPAHTLRHQVYDLVIILDDDPGVALARARKVKQEFQAGDVIEARGADFMETVHDYMKQFAANEFFNCVTISVSNRTPAQVCAEIVQLIKYHHYAILLTEKFSSAASAALAAPFSLENETIEFLTFYENLYLHFSDKIYNRFTNYSCYRAVVEEIETRREKH